MKIIHTLCFLLIIILLSCKETKNYSMKMPETMPPLFGIEKGLNSNLENETVIFEKYIQTRMGNAEANRLYSNGDFYKIYLGSNQSIKTSEVSWLKIGVISQAGIDRLKKISENNVIEYLNEGPKKIINTPTKTVNWYFYFEKPKYVKTQIKQWSFFNTPKFIKKTNKILDDFNTYE